ncbi:MAG: PAS domain S-box protein [Candidatus Scalindua sp.]|jgi:PAS domain S-box-containing protein|nr:PAS domain S-box protein [Candidatus Scalindua sp.]MDV5165841.1 PAS domain S-box protein [Candidatus Scalindua sp.]
MKLSIKSYIIFLLLFFTLLPFVALKIFAYPRIQADLKTVIMDNLEVIGNKQAELVSTWMHERMKDALVISNGPFMADSVNTTKGSHDYQSFLHYLEMIVAEYGYMGAFVINGQGIVAVATIEESIGRDLSTKDYFKHAMKGRTSATSIIPSEVPLINEFDEKEVGLPTMIVSTPLMNEDGDITGVVALRVHVGTMSNMMHSQKFGKTGESYLVSKAGYMLSESRFSGHLKTLGKVRTRSALELKLINPTTGKLTHGVRQCVSGKNGSNSTGYEDYNGIPVLGVWRWLPEYSWGVITEIDLGEAYGAAHNLKYIVTALVLSILMPIVFIAYVLGGRLSSPIIKLKEVTERMATGDLTQRVTIKRTDEIGMLATSINSMAISLEEKTKETIRSERRYRELFNSIRDGIYQCEPGVEGTFTWVNIAFAEMFGYKAADEMIGTKVKDIYADPDDRKRLVKKLEKEGLSWNFESLCKKRDGAQFNTERTSKLIRDDAGNPFRIEGIIRDTTRRKKLENSLRESEEHKRDLLDSIKEGIYQCEPGAEGVFTWVNQAGAEMFGYESPDEIIGTKVTDIYVNPDDRRKLVDALKKDGICRNFESYCKRKDGTHFYTERSSHMTKDEAGKPVRIEGIIRDTTEQKKLEDELRESEQHKRQLLNSLKEGIYQCEPGVGGKFTWVNQACAEMFGYGSPEDMIGTKVKDIYVDPDDRKKLVELLEKDGICRQFESFCKRKVGAHFYIERTTHLIRDEDGKPTRIEGVIRDTTERKKRSM